MVVGIAVLELHIAHARSLKEKRRVVQGVIDRLHQRYRVSVAETDHHDLHQRAEIGIAAVAARGRDVEHLLEELRRSVEDLPEAVVTGWYQELVEGAEG